MKQALKQLTFTFLCGFALVASAADYSAAKKDAQYTKTESGGTYTASTSISELRNLPSGYQFDTSKGVSKDPGTVRIDEYTGSFVSGTISYSNANLPTSSFVIRLSGYLLPSDDGGSEGESSQPTWSAEYGAQPFYIKSNYGDEGKNVTVPHGTSVKYSAYSGDDLQNSEWNVRSSQVTFPKKDDTEIRFNKSFWVSLWPWSAPNITDPTPGIYTINAKAVSPATGEDSGTMTVVDGEFKEHNNHAYGFDDYTNWSKNAADYYGAKTGKCTLPYASVKSGGNGNAKFNLIPSLINKDVEFSSSTSRMTYSPEKTQGNCDIAFTATSGWFSSSATLSAELNNTTFAQLGVNSFDQASKQMLIVLVVPNASTTTTAPAGASSTTLNKVYQQVVLSINCSTDTFIYSAAPSTWASSDRSSLKNAFIASPPAGISPNNYDHILFVVTGSDSGTALAWGEVGGKYMWIYTSTNYAYVVAHELGHNYGLGDQYNSSNGIVTMGDDKYNLMNAVSTAIHSNQYRLRRSQWTTIR